MDLENVLQQDVGINMDFEKMLDEAEKLELAFDEQQLDFDLDDILDGSIDDDVLNEQINIIHNQLNVINGEKPQYSPETAQRPFSHSFNIVNETEPELEDSTVLLTSRLDMLSDLLTKRNLRNDVGQPTSISVCYIVFTILYQ
eukprot:TRINITY_DN6516_c0_g3_i1.p1 TRINITY_DN6516_c0_g3~~TRINITY_DN6516_c0_g3_i1.p1  ORF type:complete len:143 (-),score=43.99 TRINITY_DN6516_c0_g3_i1:61-489(-)